MEQSIRTESPADTELPLYRSLQATQRQILRLGSFGCLLLALVCCFGCQVTRPIQRALVPARQKSYASKLSEVELRAKLATFYVDFVNTVEFASAEAASHVDDIEVRRRLIAGRVRAVRSCRQAIFQRQTMAAFVDTWSLCIQVFSLNCI
jgi:hypothetical protein